MQDKRIKYAGFWVRCCAAIIDGIVIYISIMITYKIPKLILWLIAFSLLEEDPTLFFLETVGFIDKLLTVLGIIGFIILPWLYFSLMESSYKQATLGKQALRIKVANINGESISFERATGRYFAKFISNLSLLVGYIMAAFTKKKQALHDTIAGTLVIKAKKTK